MTRPLLFVVASLVVACGPPPPGADGGVDGGDVVAGPLELRTTNEQDQQVPLSGDVFAHPGSQGGYHVNGLYSLPEGGSGQLTFEHRVVRASDEKLVSVGSRVFDLGAARVSTWSTPAPVTIFICPTPVGVDVVGQELVFTVKAKDQAGRVVASGTARATFRCGAMAGTYCEMICKG
jgi:hypothetical protein